MGTNYVDFISRRGYKGQLWNALLPVWLRTNSAGAFIHLWYETNGRGKVLEIANWKRTVRRHRGKKGIYLSILAKNWLIHILTSKAGSHCAQHILVRLWCSLWLRRLCRPLNCWNKLVQQKSKRKAFGRTPYISCPWFQGQSSFHFLDFKNEHSPHFKHKHFCFIVQNGLEQFQHLRSFNVIFCTGHNIIHQSRFFLTKKLRNLLWNPWPHSFMQIMLHMGQKSSLTQKLIPQRSKQPN